jgi:hypothetical protein
MSLNGIHKQIKWLFATCVIILFAAYCLVSFTSQTLNKLTIQNEDLLHERKKFDILNYELNSIMPSCIKGQKTNDKK